jgi:MoxR-like ATPase
MARLTYPDRDTLITRLRASGTGVVTTVDSISDATLHTNPDWLSVGLSADGWGLNVQYATEPVPHWTVVASPTEQPHTPGAPVTLPEALLVRANRLMSPDGVSLQRDWRTKAHVLRAAPRQVLPLYDGAGVSAARTSTGWQALDPSRVGSLVAPSPAPTPAPTGPSPEGAEHPQPGLGAPEVAPPVLPAPSATNGVLQALPAAYAGKIVLSKTARQKWEMARAAHRAGQPMVIAMVGPSGAGKTHAVHALSADEGLEVVKFDASGVVEPGDWFGTVTLDGSGTKFVPSDLLLAITLPGARTLLLDEVNRANLRALNAMLPLLDGSGSVTIPQTGKRERVNRAVQIVVTANIGSAFLGTEPLDEAIRTRIGSWIMVDPLTETDEKALLLDRVPGLSEYQAANLARLGALTRQSAESGAHPPVSTRQLLSAAWQIATYGERYARLAVEAAVLDGFNAEGASNSERALVLTHVAGIAWREPKAGQVMTGTGLCHCGHGAEQHGIGTEVSASTHCRTCVRVYPNNALAQCMAFNPVTVPAEDGEVPA